MVLHDTCRLPPWRGIPIPTELVKYTPTRKHRSLLFYWKWSFPERRISDNAPTTSPPSGNLSTRYL